MQCLFVLATRKATKIYVKASIMKGKHCFCLIVDLHSSRGVVLISKFFQFDSGTPNEVYFLFFHLSVCLLAELYKSYWLERLEKSEHGSRNKDPSKF